MRKNKKCKTTTTTKKQLIKLAKLEIERGL